MTHDELQKFNEVLWAYYTEHGRHDLPWRKQAADGGYDPYKIMVSEIMLQQTQVQRVIPKFNEFLIKFPTIKALATSELGTVLTAWSGLGYNRRAKFLWQAAQQINASHTMAFPSSSKELIALPGIGVNTAGAILAYAYNMPTLFIETNVRTVFIHHFLSNEEGVDDASIKELLENALDKENPRQYYWALMDYGTHLKQSVGNLSRQSKSYAKQSKFEGSRRQIRGQVLRLLANESMSLQYMKQIIPDDRLESVLHDLLREELIRYQKSTMHFYV